jgi:hypothetical protein
MFPSAGHGHMSMNLCHILPCMCSLRLQAGRHSGPPYAPHRAQARGGARGGWRQESRDSHQAATSSALTFIGRLILSKLALPHVCPCSLGMTPTATHPVARCASAPRACSQVGKWVGHGWQVAVQAVYASWAVSEGRGALLAAAASPDPCTCDTCCCCRSWSRVLQERGDDQGGAGWVVAGCSPP